MQGNSSLEKQPQLTEETKSFPLSYGQQAMWFLYQIAPQSIAYNIYTTVRINSELDLEAWHRAWLQIVERHPILRTTYAQYEDQPIQIIHPYQEIDIKVTDASTWELDYLEKKNSGRNRASLQLGNRSSIAGTSIYKIISRTYPITGHAPHCWRYVVF